MVDQLHLEVRPEVYAVCKLDPTEPWPALPASTPGLYSVSRSETEVSIICTEDLVPPNATVEPGWRALTITGELEFDLIGILAGVTSAIAAASISVFALSTFDTDHLFVRTEDLSATVTALRGAGYLVTE